MESIQEQLKTTDKSDDLKMKNINKDITGLEMTVKQNNKVAKILSQKI